MKIAILGFGHAPPEYNLELATIAGEQLAAAGHCVVVGNSVGTFAAAIESAASKGGQTMAVLDEATIARQTLPASTEIFAVASFEKHQQIATRVDAGLVLGGAEGTRKLVAQLLAKEKPLIAVEGTGGAVDDRSLPDSIQIVDSIELAVQWLLTTLGG